ncbi:MAG: hypothetical protein K2X72_27585 [Reyranella sp.]|nr:hypothetical protein [Reyranella sp.]
MRVLKRILVMAGAYLAGVLGFCVALALLFGVASLLPDSLGYWVLPAGRGVRAFGRLLRPALLGDRRTKGGELASLK